MQISFKYEVCERNSAMYPGPPAASVAHLTSSMPQEADPGWKKDPLWVCTLCQQPVLDELGKQKFARSFLIAADKSGALKEPDNWYHCDPCRQACRDDKRALALKASAVGTPCINKVLPVGGGTLW